MYVVWMPGYRYHSVLVSKSNGTTLVDKGYVYEPTQNDLY